MKKDGIALIEKRTPGEKFDKTDIEKIILDNVREDLRDSTYIKETITVIKAKGFRSAIGCYWNAVIDDLRNKVIYRSLDLFNKELDLKPPLKTYEDFQDHVTDHVLIEGAYRIGVIGWEAKKMLTQAKDTRHIFDGHPKSSVPDLLKVLAFISDCNKYVLSQEMPTQIINIDEYLTIMDSPDYAKNSVAVEQAFSDLPNVYKTELVNKFYNHYISDLISSVFRANIEFCFPILWSVLSKEDRKQIGKRLDADFLSGNDKKIKKGMSFLALVDGMSYTSLATRKGIFTELILGLEKVLDNWDEEGKLVERISRLGALIPDDLISKYVCSLTLTYVGYKGRSLTFARTDFYSDQAAPIIKKLFEKFDHNSDRAFINTIKTNSILKSRIVYPSQLSRLRDLANIILNRPGIQKEVKDFLDLLIDDSRADELFKVLSRPKK